MSDQDGTTPTLSKEQLVSFVKHLPFAVAMFDRDLRYLQASDRWIQNYKLAQDLTGRSMYEVYPEMPDHWRDLHRRALAGETLSGEDERVAFDDGRVHWARWEIRPWGQRDGLPEGILIFTEDITDRKSAELAVKASEERLRRALETDAVGVLFLNQDGALVDANDVYFGMTGYTRAEFAEKRLTWRDLTPPEWIAASEEQMEKLARTGRLGPYEKETVLKDGSRRWMLFAGRDLGNGTVVEYCFDVTDRKLAEHALQKRESQLHAALEAMTDAVFISDTEGRFIELNEAFATFHKFRSKDECARTLAEYPAIVSVIQPNGEALRFEDWAVPRALRGESARNAEYSLERKDTGERWVGSFNFAPIRDRDGVITGSVVVGRDITEQKKAEQALRESEQWLRLALKASSAGAWTLDLRNRAVVWDERSRVLFGVAPGRPANFGIALQRIHQEDVAKVESRLLEMRDRAGDDEWNLEFRTVGEEDGRVRWVQALGRAERDAQGRMIRMDGINLDITARKEAEQALRISEERYRTLVEQASDGIILHDARGRLLDVNRAACESLGYSREELLGLVVFDIATEIDRAAAEAEWASAAPGESTTVRTLWRKQDGSQFPVEVRRSVFLRGGERFLLAIVRNLSERTAALEALHQANRQYRDLVENSPDGIARFDRHGRYLFVNRKIAEFGRREISDFEGKSIGTVAAPDSESWAKLLEQVVATGRGEVREFCFPAEERKPELWLRIRFAPEIGPGGRVQSVLMIATDITEQRHLETLAKERESIIAALFDTAAQAILAVDLEGRIQLANRMAADQFGYDADALIGMAIEELLPQPVRVKHEQFRRKFQENGSQRQMGVNQDLRARRKDGTTFPVEVSLSQVQTGKGILTVSFVSDISERKKQEAALREREAELRRLSMALVTADEDAARLIAMELHDDITQRLALASVELGRSATAAAATEETLREAARSCQARMLEISEGIRRIAHRMHPAILDDLGLSAALEGLCFDLQEVGSLRVHYQSRGVPETVDPAVSACLYRVCQESLRNIAKHANADEVNVVLEGDADELQLTIIDSGVGFDTTLRQPGLGLYSMRERVGLIRGTITIDSLRGEGTRVVVRAPVTLEKAQGLPR